jgi:dienelactone hydrolase
MASTGYAPTMRAAATAHSPTPLTPNTATDSFTPTSSVLRKTPQPVRTAQPTIDVTTVATPLSRSTTYGWYAAAIDGPVHGEHGPVTDANHPAYRDMWQRGGAVETMIDDWQATLNALGALDDIDHTRVGYWGVSMGTMFGLPYVASDARVRVAALGKARMRDSSVKRSCIDVHFKTYAPKVHVPVLFTMQWDDERFERDGQLQLFDRIGAKDKCLHAYPGLHIDNGPEAFQVQAEFLKRYL